MRTSDFRVMAKVRAAHPTDRVYRGNSAFGLMEFADQFGFGPT